MTEGPVRGKPGASPRRTNTPASENEVIQRTMCLCIGRPQTTTDEDGDLVCVRCGKAKL
jgi:hypothetical protein